MAGEAVVQIQFIARLSLGLVFFASAITKFRDIPAFVRGVLDYAILPDAIARLFGVVLPFAEMGTALLLLIGIFPLLSSCIAALLLLSFSVALAINAARGRAISCHCFGTSLTNRIGWHSLVRDLTLLPCAGWLISIAVMGVHAPPTSRSFTIPAAGIAIVMALLYALLVEGVDLYFSLLKEPFASPRAAAKGGRN